MGGGTPFVNPDRGRDRGPQDMPPARPQQRPASPEPQMFSSASYSPRRPVTPDEPVAAPVPQGQEPVYGEEDVRRDYTDRPRNKLDVPAFLRK